MNKIKHLYLSCIAVIMTIILFSAFVFFFSACESSENPGGDPEVSKIAVTKLPDKTDYYTGEVFSAEGGEITVTYTDKTTVVKKMTDAEVEITAPELIVADESNPDREQVEKNVIVVFDGKRTTFKIKVNVKKYNVTFNYCYDDRTESISVIENKTVSEPAVADRDDYRFDKWYSDKLCTIAYNFSEKITEDIVLYANWLEKAVYYNFTFRYNHVGSKPESVVNPVKEGESAVRLGKDPERIGYRFDGWYTAAEGGVEYDFKQSVSADTEVYAHWTRVQPMESKEYTFEAEDLNLKGIKGPGASGQASGKSMIVYKQDRNASGNRFVSYLYAKNITLTFELVSDIETTANIAVSLSVEMRDIVLSPDNYLIRVNGESQNYNPITLNNVPKPTTDSSDCRMFQIYSVGNNIQLKKGVNKIELVTNNTVGIEGTTMTAMAPLVDCLKVNTDAVLTWNNSLGYPADNY